MSSLEFWPQDRVQLAEGVIFTGRGLQDLLTNRFIALNEVAALLVGSLDKGRSIKDCIEPVSKANDWDFQEVSSDFMQLLDELDKSSLLLVRKDWKSRLGFNALKLQAVSYLMLEWPRAATRRYKPTVLYLVGACLRAGSLGIFFSLAITLALLTTTVPQFGSFVPAEKYLYCATPLLLCLFFLAHVIIHEAGHLVASNALDKNSSKFIFVRGFRIGVAHDTILEKKKSIVAMCGPAAGLVGAQLIALCLLAIPFVAPLALLMSISGTVHLYSLFPWTADGKQIWQRKERHS